MLHKKHRLRKSSEFADVLRSGARRGGRNVVVSMLKRDDQEPSIVGFLVSKKVGNAVIRNKVKRRCRQISQEFLHDHPEGFSLVIRALPPCAAASYEEIQRELSRLSAQAMSKGGWA